MSVSFGSRAPSKAAVDELRSARNSYSVSRDKMRAAPQPDETPSVPSDPIRLEESIAARWAVRDQFGRGTCVAFATLAAIELRQARETDTLADRLSEEFFHTAMLTRHPLSNEVAAEVPEGGVLLSQAWHALKDDGVAGSENAPYKPGFRRLKDLPAMAPEAVAEAGNNKRRAHAYGTIGVPTGIAEGDFSKIKPAEGTDLTILGFLQEERPVAVGVPLFRHASGLSNWTLPSAIQSGVILCPEDAGAAVLDGPRNDGHVVCVTGFIPDVSEPRGGWFVFRNSWGLEFASHAAFQTVGMSSGARGYGLISATHINLYCWEYLVPDAPQTSGVS